MKKSWIIFWVAMGVVLLGSAFWLLRSQPPKVSDMEITKAVPLDAVLLCYFERADILNETVNNPSSGWSRFVPQDKLLMQLLRNLQSTASKNTLATELLRSKAIYSVHPQGKGVASLIVVAWPPEYSAEQWEGLLEATGKPVAQQAYHSIYIHSLGSGDSTLYIAATGNMVLFSQSQLLLQNTIRHINSDQSLNDDAAFKQVMQTAGVNSDVRLFINHRGLNALTAAVGGDVWRRYSPVLPYMADWTALDGQASPNVVHLNGFVFPSFTDDNFLSLLLSQSAANTTAWTVLPAETLLAYNLGLTSATDYLAGYRGFLEKHKLAGDYTKTLTALDERLQTNIVDLFSSFYVDEVAAACMAGNNGGWVSLFKTANPKYVIEQLKILADVQEMPFAVSDKKENVLFHNPVQGMMNALFGEPFAGIGDAYFLVHQDWIIFGDSKELLLSLHQDRMSLRKYLQTTQAAQYISGNSVFSAFINPAAADNAALLSYFNTSFQKDFAKALQAEAFKVACLQLRPSGDKLYTTLFAIYDSDEKPVVKQPEQVVQHDEVQPQPATTVTPQPVVADTPSAAPAAAGDKVQRKFSVINHSNKAQEYFVQYSDNTIALLDKSGAQQWSQRIDGALVDTLYQIDFYKNGKLQMLFITANKLYLIDRKGQLVAPFPLTLSPAAKCLSVFDYEKNRDYRLFVLQGNTVNAYDKKGRAVDGWQPFTPKPTVTRAPEFFRVGGRDFIVVCDEKTTHLLDRKGNERLALSEPVAVKPNTPITAQQAPPVLKVTTTNGKTVTISLKDGKVN